ncbi:hypothetical protein [Cohnella silvisoli]|uniref:Uncharacterized protein n=1 Tax=Cohnella silvisoli TaxID=2873699 RepID=A0ABV1L334_9BACL|nr:hypothetical protein [Cohnella silvisoli]MCD9026088.1 hypothetical protein [Cohnella silvisoli]
MQWQEVRQLYPDRFVKMQILKSHIENQVRYVENVAVIQAFDDEQTATRELVRSKDDVLVYHTGKEKIEIEIKPLFGFRGSYDKHRV